MKSDWVAPATEKAIFAIMVNLKHIVQGGLLSLLLSAAAPSNAQQKLNSYLYDAVTSREHPLDITHMKVEVSFVPEQGLVKGKVSHQFNVLQRKVDSVFFDGPGITIQNATLNGKTLRYRTQSTGIWVFPERSLEWDQTGTIVFTYEAKPKRGIYFIGWNQPEPSTPDPFAVRKQIWTQGQGIDNRHWIPMYDDMNDKFITETVVTFDAAYEVLSNGKLQSKKKNKDGSNTWHYAMSKPHAGYLLMLGIGKYAVATDRSKSGVPLQFWYYPEFKDRMEPTFRHSARMIDFLEAQTGIPYPWESYSQIMVQEFIYGAMENTTATIFGDFFNVDARAFLDRNYIGVNCHELTHQWFGDFITARDSRDAWLQESFATYFPKQLSRVLDGEDEWNWQRRSHQNSAIEAGKKDLIPVRNTGGGTARVYPKGAAVISMLEYVLGEEQWKRALNLYLRRHAYGNVETSDLQQAIKDALGLNLDWFFDEWIYRGGEPHYRVHYEDLRYADGSRGTEIAIEQIHAKDETVRAFQMPVLLEVHYKDGSVSQVKEMLRTDFEVVKIANAGNREIDFVLFDPNSNILKQVTFNKSFSELEAQLLRAVNMLDRYDALVALRSTPMEKKRDLLFGVLAKERHEAILNEAVSQLCSDKRLQSDERLLNMMKHSKASVRDHLLKQLEVHAGNAALFETALSDSSYEVVKTAFEKLCTANPRKTGEYAARLKGVAGMHHAVELKVLEMRMLNNNDPEDARARLCAFAGPAYEFRTRNLAFNTLKATGTFDGNVAAALFQAVLSPNSRLSAPAAELCNYFATNLNYRAEMKRVYNEGNYGAADRETLTRSISFLKY